ncbi:MAG: glycosyltransferase family 4 protein [Gemmatimonadota bacterium]|nr:glycosyltransferase family 4 protein [Gemmatimonadota bacterium]
MRILFFSDHFRPEPSAPAAHVHERAKLWASWGHEVTVLTSAPNFPEGKLYPGYRNRWRGVETMDGIRVVRVKTFIARNEGFVLRILDYLSYCICASLMAWFEARPDVIISTSPHLFVAVAGVVHGRLRRVPHVMEVRDLWPATIAATGSLRKGRVYRRLEDLELWLYQNSAQVIVLTRSFERDLIRRRVPAGKVKVVVNGANLELFSPRPRDPEVEQAYQLANRFVVGYLGTLGLSHGLDNIIQAAEFLRETSVVFYFVGVGADKAHLEALVAERGLRNVIFAPRQLKEEMPRYWSLCDASLVHLKDDEVFQSVIPSKIFESMAMGLPIIFVGPSGEGSDIVTEAGAGIVVAPGRPAALAEAVLALARDPERCRALGGRSLAAAPRWSRDRQARDTLAVLAQAAGIDG